MSGPVKIKDGVKHCVKCGQWLPFNDFYTAKKGKLSSYCKSCVKGLYQDRKKAERNGQVLIRRTRCSVNMRSDTKRCPTCSRWLAHQLFHRDQSAKSGLAGQCKKCASQYKRSVPQAQNREGKLRRNYGFSQERYDQLLKNQGGVCAICKTSVPGGRYKGFHVDHDHRTGKIRGILCPKCNGGLGFFTDSPIKLEMAAEYLRFNH